MKKNKSSRHIVYMLAVCALVAAAAVLTGCTGQMENLFTRPQKVTIEHNATVEPTPTPEPTATPTPTPTPVPTAEPDPAAGSTSADAASTDSSAVDGNGTAVGGTDASANGTDPAANGNTSAVNGTDPAAGGTGAETNTTGQAGQEEQPEKAELPEGTLEPVGVTKEEADAAAEAMHEKVIEAANFRLDNGYYSKETLISGLMEDGFSYEEATYGAEHCYIDWGY